MHHKKKLFLTLLAFITLLFLIARIPPNHLQQLHQLQHQLRRCHSSPSDRNSSASDACPSYFSWIQHDLSPWQSSKISSKLLHRQSKPLADFRVVIVDGKLYTERYRFCYQTRAQYTLWGLLMLLERFPGLVPDLELMFSCGDKPQVVRQVVRRFYNTLFLRQIPPPLFSYCTTRNGHLDIVFPDWSFWGWPEVDIAPWSLEMEKIFSGAQKVDWVNRTPIAQWKGNTWMGDVRRTLRECDNSFFLFSHQDWESEVKNNFSSSNLADQCSYKYKVYVEGIGWSVSLKYIMSCGSTMLQVEPTYHDFYSRSLVPYLHFLPVSTNPRTICEHIRRAVRWGNEFPVEAQAIGICAQEFLKEELTMEHVYQYMLQLLQSYAKLLEFKPVPPPGVEAMTLNSTLKWQDVSLQIPASVKPFCGK